MCFLYVNVMTTQTVKENPSLLLSHADTKQRPHVSDIADDKKDQRKKKLSNQGKSCNINIISTFTDNNNNNSNNNICISISVYHVMVVGQQEGHLLCRKNYSINCMVSFGNPVYLNKSSPKVIWEECIATPKVGECTLPLCVLAVQ